MTSPPRILFIDDDLGAADRSERVKFCAARSLRIVEQAEAGGFAGSQDAGILAEAYFHSGLDEAGALSVEAVKRAVAKHWWQDGENGDWRWALVCVDMSFVVDGRGSNFGAEIVCALRADKRLHNVPLALISGMDVSGVEKALSEAAKKYGGGGSSLPARLAKHGDPSPLESFARLLFREAFVEDGALRMVDGEGKVCLVDPVEAPSSTIGTSIALLSALQRTRAGLAAAAMRGEGRGLFLYVSNPEDDDGCFSRYIQIYWQLACEHYERKGFFPKGFKNSWTSVVNLPAAPGRYEIENIDRYSDENLAELEKLFRKSPSATGVISALYKPDPDEFLKRVRRYITPSGIFYWPSISDRRYDLARYANSLNPSHVDIGASFVMHEDLNKFFESEHWPGGLCGFREAVERAFERVQFRGGFTVFPQDFTDPSLGDLAKRSETDISFQEMITVMKSFRFKGPWEVEGAWPPLRDALAPILLSMFEVGEMHPNAKRAGKLNAAGLARLLRVPGIDDTRVNSGTKTNETTKIADFVLRLADEYGLDGPLINELKEPRLRKARLDRPISVRARQRAK